MKKYEKGQIKRKKKSKAQVELAWIALKINDEV